MRLTSYHTIVPHTKLDEAAHALKVQRQAGTYHAAKFLQLRNWTCQETRQLLAVSSNKNDSLS